MEFPEVFWDATLSYFGAALPGGQESRGAASIFWNLLSLTGAKQLTALIAGSAAYASENAADAELTEQALSVLRTLFGADNVPDPVGVSITRWMSDDDSKGRGSRPAHLRPGIMLLPACLPRFSTEAYLSLAKAFSNLHTHSKSRQHISTAFGGSSRSARLVFNGCISLCAQKRVDLLLPKVILLIIAKKVALRWLYPI